MKIYYSNYKYYGQNITEYILLSGDLSGEETLHIEVHPPARQEAGDEGGRDERHVPGRGLQAGLVSLRLLQSLGLGPPVLEPDLDLGVGQLEAVGELGPLGDGEVALLNILLLQLGELLVGEGSPGLPVRLVFPQSALQWQLGHWRA